MGPVPSPHDMERQGRGRETPPPACSGCSQRARFKCALSSPANTLGAAQRWCVSADCQPALGDEREQQRECGAERQAAAIRVHRGTEGTLPGQPDPSCSVQTPRSSRPAAEGLLRASEVPLGPPSPLPVINPQHDLQALCRPSQPRSSGCLGTLTAKSRWPARPAASTSKTPRPTVPQGTQESQPPWAVLLKCTAGVRGPSASSEFHQGAEDGLVWGQS